MTATETREEQREALHRLRHRQMVRLIARFGIARMRAVLESAFTAEEWAAMVEEAGRR